jgi:queuine tRNA-ribosyltransferase
MGTPRDLLDAIALGVDLFDCVLPTRNARNGMAFTHEGTLNIRNAVHARDRRPLDPECGCEACAEFSRAYLRHLHLAGEMLAHRMLTLHNVTFYQTLMAGARAAIERDAYPEFHHAVTHRFRERAGDAAGRVSGDPA